MKKEAFDILSDLVAIDTSIEKSTTEAVDYIEALFRRYDIKAHIIPAESDRRRASLIATIGDKNRPGIVLSGHLDTYGVTSQLQNWKTNPFKTEIIDGRVVGRGVVDMKGGIACALGQIEEFSSLDMPVHFVFTHDEEGRFTAINQLLRHNFYNCFSSRQLGCIVMEPSQSLPLTAHKGYQRNEIKIHNTASPSKNKEYVTGALGYAIEMYGNIEKCFNNIKWQHTELFADSGASLNIGKLHSGTSAFCVPEDAILEFQYKYEHGESRQQTFLDNLTVYFNKMRWEAEQKGDKLEMSLTEKIHILPFRCPEDSRLLKVVRQKTDFQKSLITNYGSEAGYFQKFGLPTLILGPGDYKQAHRSNESLKLVEFEHYQLLLNNIVQSLQNEPKAYFCQNCDGFSR